MSQDRIKSAWEIALEKAEKLGKLSPEEAQKRLEEEFYPRGKALAEKYLKGLPRRDLDIALGKFTNEKENAIVKRGFLAALTAEISLEEAEKSGRALEGILLISGDSELAKTKENIMALFNKYKEARESLYSSSQQTITNRVIEQLKEEALSGSAIRINVLAAKEWQEAQAELLAGHEGELELLKKRLLENTS